MGRESTEMKKHQDAFKTAIMQGKFEYDELVAMMFKAVSLANTNEMETFLKVVELDLSDLTV